MRPPSPSYQQIRAISVGDHMEAHRMMFKTPSMKTEPAFRQNGQVPKVQNKINVPKCRRFLLRIFLPDNKLHASALPSPNDELNLQKLENRQEQTTIPTEINCLRVTLLLHCVPSSSCKQNKWMGSRPTQRTGMEECRKTSAMIPLTPPDFLKPSESVGGSQNPKVF